MRYAVVYLKGGVGKTTIALHLACYFARTRKTLLIDGDPQESAATWAAWRRDMKQEPNPTTIRLKGTAILDEGITLSESHEHTVIDAGGRDGAGMRNALLMAERVIIPIGHSGFDAAVLDEFLERIKEAKAFNRGLQCAVLFNRLHAKANMQELYDFIEERGVPMFEQHIGERRVYSKAVSEGLTVEEYKPKVAAATHELRKFYEEVENWS